MPDPLSKYYKSTNNDKFIQRLIIFWIFICYEEEDTWLYNTDPLNLEYQNGWDQVFSKPSEHMQDHNPMIVIVLYVGPKQHPEI